MWRTETRASSTDARAAYRLWRLALTARCAPQRVRGFANLNSVWLGLTRYRDLSRESATEKWAKASRGRNPWTVTPQAKVPEAVVRRIAVAAEADPKTVRRVLRGER